MESIVQGFRQGLRRLWTKPGLVIVAVVTLALGLGANAAIFSVVDAIWLRPLPIRDPQGLIGISEVKVDGTDEGTSYSEYTELRRQASTLSDIAAVSWRSTILKHSGEAKVLLVGEVSPNYFSLLGPRTTIGRVLTEGELTVPGPPPLVMLGYGAWVHYFAADPLISGRAIILNNTSCVVAGVMPRGFRGIGSFVEPEIWIPTTTWQQVTPDDSSLVDRADHRFSLLARLAPKRSIDEARLEINLITGRFAKDYPKTDLGRKVSVSRESDLRDPFLRSLSRALFVLATLVLLIACANVANLVLAHGEGRRKEIAMRLALGAKRVSMICQLVFEGLPLTVVGTAFALLLARWIIALLPSLLPIVETPLGYDFRLDSRVLLFATSLCLVSTALVGIIPAIRLSDVAPIAILKEPSAVIKGARHRSLLNLVVIVQVAGSVVLVSGAGLLVKTFMQVENRDSGFNRKQQMVLVDLDVGTLRANQIEKYLDQVIERVHAIPGVKSAAFARFIPFGLSSGGATKAVFLSGQKAPTAEGEMNLMYSSVTPEYFQTLGISIVAGRGFTASDRGTSPNVIVISQALARILFAKGDPLDQYLRVGGMNGADFRIVGVAKDVTYNDLTESAQPYIYLPIAQVPAFEGTLAISTTTDASSMRHTVVRTVQELNKEVPVLNPHTLKERMRSASYVQRLSASLVSVLGSLALLLASVGLYSVISYSVSRRTHEIGIRMAMGATRGTVLRLVIETGLWLTGMGGAIGLVGAIAMTRALSSLLYGVSPNDPSTFVIAVAVMLFVSVLASIVPARRAAMLNPLMALRYE